MNKRKSVRRPRRTHRTLGVWRVFPVLWGLWLLWVLPAAGCGPRENGTASGGGEADAPFWVPAHDIELPDYVQTDLLPVNQYSRPGTYLSEVNGVVIHYVGNPGSSARGNRNYFASLADGTTGTYASSHFVVGLEGEVIQCVPLTEIAYCSNQRNRDTISIEVCHPDDTGKFSDVTYSRVVELTGWLCGSFGLDPKQDVIRHYDVTGKECPRYYVRNPEAWEQFRADVAARLPWTDPMAGAWDSGDVWADGGEGWTDGGSGGGAIPTDGGAYHRPVISHEPGAYLLWPPRA